MKTIYLLLACMTMGAHAFASPQETPIEGRCHEMGFHGPCHSADSLHYTLFVDSKACGGGDGSISSPFATIQEAINTIQPAFTLESKARGYTIFIASGIYDEDLTINLYNAQVEFIALGPVYLAGNTLPVPTPRNVTINFIANTSLGIQFGDSVSFSCVNANIFSNGTPQLAQVGKFEILGTLYINDLSSAAGVVNSVIYNGSVIGGINGTGSTKAHYLWFNNAYIIPPIQSPKSIISAKNSAFISMVDCLTYGEMHASFLSNGMTIALLPQEIDQGPLVGFYSSTLHGTFTGPAPNYGQHAFLFDSATNYWFSRNGASLDGGATIEVLALP